MGQKFDPYHTWLGIPAEDQPPHHYRLLGLEPLEDDREVIVNAINQRTAHVQSKQAGPHADIAGQLLAKISAARICLLTPEKKEEYDTALRHGIGKRAPAGSASPAKQKIKTAQPLPTAKPLTAAKTAAKPVAKSAPRQPAPAKPAADPAESAQPTQKPRFKGEPEAAAPAPAPTPTPASAPAPAPAPGPQILAENPPRYRQRRKSSWVGMVLLLLFLIVAAGGATAAAYYMGYLPLRGPEVAAKTNADNGDQEADDAPDAKTADDAADSDSSDGGNPPATATDEPSTDTTLTDDHSNSGGGADSTGSTDAGGPDRIAALPDPDALDKLTDEPWAGLFEDKPPDDTTNPPTATAGESPKQPADVSNQQSQRRPVPSPADQDAAKTVVRQIFRDDIAAARTSQARVELAQKLITYAEQTKKDPAARYTLLALARDLAAYAGESLLMLQTVDQLASEYEVDALAMKSNTFQLAGRSAPNAQVLGGVMQTTRKLIGQAVRESRYEIAVELGEMCLSGARRLRSRDQVTECSALLKDINTRKTRYEFAQRARETLQSNPKDPEANLALGKYLVITDRNWSQGIPYLAKGADNRLAEVARLELSQPSDAQAKTALAERWEKLSLAHRGGQEELLYRRRAIHWFQQSLAQLEGLDKIAAAKKLERLGADVDLTAEIPAPAKPAADDGLSTLETPDDGKTSDAELLDTIADQPPAVKPAEKQPSPAPAATPEPAKAPPKTPPVTPAAASDPSVEEFLGPRPPKPAEDDGGSGFFGD